MQIVCSYSILMDLLNDTSRLFIGNRLPGAVSTLYHIRDQKNTKYFLLNGYDKIINDENQPVPILKLKQSFDLHKAPTDIQDESVWNMNKTGRLVVFNECDYKFNSNRNDISFRIYCNPYDDEQVLKFLNGIKHLGHVQNSLIDYITGSKVTPITNILVYADQYILSKGPQIEIPLNLKNASVAIAAFLLQKIVPFIESLSQSKQSIKRKLFLYINSEKVLEKYPSIGDKVSRCMELVQSEMQKRISYLKDVEVLIVLQFFHDRFIFSDYFMIRSTNSIDTKWSNVNCQGISLNTGEYYKGIKHVVFGRYGKSAHGDHTPEIYRLATASPIEDFLYDRK